MDLKRHSRGGAHVYASERIVGEEQWHSARGKTLGEFLGQASIWILTGIGLAMGLVGWIMPWLARRSLAEAWGTGLLALVLFAVVASHAAAWILAAGVLDRARMWGSRAAALVPLLLSAGIVLLGWSLHSRSSEPDVVIIAELGGRFAFGPALTEDLIKRLDREGFVGVVSLLHPLGEPPEPELLEQENAWTSELGVELVRVSWHPAEGLNEEALERLLSVAQGDRGPYYVHVGEDRNRREIARNLLIRATEGRAVLINRLRGVDTFERGPVQQLEEGVFLTPFPTDSELLNYYLGGSVRSVVSLLDPERPDHRRWTLREGMLLSRFGIELYHEPVTDQMPFVPEGAVGAAEAVRALPKPVVVHAFLSPSVRVDAFVQAYLGGVPPLPPGLFREPLRGGRIQVVAPNVAVGPRPEGPEFGALYLRGVRSIAWVGRRPPADLREDRTLSGVAGLEWHSFGGDEDELITNLGKGGPWYLYGPESAALAKKIADRYGPAVPAPSKGSAEESSSGVGMVRSAPVPGTGLERRVTAVMVSGFGGEKAPQEALFGATIRSDYGI